MTDTNWDRYKKLDDQYRLDKIFEGFETEHFSISEDRKRQMSLLQQLNINGDDMTLRRLMEKLEHGSSTGRHVKSLASSFSMRSLRCSMIGRALLEFEQFHDSNLKVFTILNTRWVLTPEELLKTRASKVKEQFARDLRRAGVDGPLVAFLHGEYEPAAGVFVLHFHGVALKDEYDNLHSLSGKWGYDPTASKAHAIRCDDVNDRVRQFSYLLKSFWPEREVAVGDGRTDRARKAARIREPFHSIMLTWLDRQTPMNISLWWDARSEEGQAREMLLSEMGSEMMGKSQKK